jgi:hypothetical protein
MASQLESVRNAVLGASPYALYAATALELLVLWARKNQETAEEVSTPLAPDVVARPM